MLWGEALRLRAAGSRWELEGTPPPFFFLRGSANGAALILATDATRFNSFAYRPAENRGSQERRIKAENSTYSWIARAFVTVTQPGGGGRPSPLGEDVTRRC